MPGNERYGYFRYSKLWPQKPSFILKGKPVIIAAFYNLFHLGELKFVTDVENQTDIRR
jgi:hypothetical protein